MFDKFKVLMSWKLSWVLSFLLFGVCDGHIFFDFSNYCPYIIYNIFFHMWYLISWYIYSLIAKFDKMDSVRGLRGLSSSRTKLLPYTNFYVEVLTQFWIKLLHVEVLTKVWIKLLHVEVLTIFPDKTSTLTK